MDYYIPRGHKNKRNKIFLQGTKKKTRYYYGDRNEYRNEYLKSEHWKELREKKLNINPICEKCGSDKRVEPHHLNYKNLYDVQLEDLRSLCRKCHKYIHEEPIRKLREEKQRKKVRRKEKREKRLLRRSVEEEKIDKGYLILCELEKNKIKYDG